MYTPSSTYNPYNTVHEKPYFGVETDNNNIITDVIVYSGTIDITFGNFRFTKPVDELTKAWDTNFNGRITCVVLVYNLVQQTFSIEFKALSSIVEVGGIYYDQNENNEDTLNIALGEITTQDSGEYVSSYTYQELYNRNFEICSFSNYDLGQSFNMYSPFLQVDKYCNLNIKGEAFVYDLRNNVLFSDSNHYDLPLRSRLYSRWFSSETIEDSLSNENPDFLNHYREGSVPQSVRFLDSSTGNDIDPVYDDYGLDFGTTQHTKCLEITPQPWISIQSFTIIQSVNFKSLTQNQLIFQILTSDGDSEIYNLMYDVTNKQFLFTFYLYDENNSSGNPVTLKSIQYEIVENVPCNLTFSLMCDVDWNFKFYLMVNNIIVLSIPVSYYDLNSVEIGKFVFGSKLIGNNPESTSFLGSFIGLFIASNYHTEKFLRAFNDHNEVYNVVNGSGFGGF